jgi:predicted nucleic acid-binding protein
VIPTVYLDTNIIIGGGRRPEHLSLRDLAKKKLIRLYIGRVVSREIRKQNTDLEKKRQEIIALENKISNKEFVKLMEVNDQQLNLYNTRLHHELEFWREVAPDYPRTTFSEVLFALDNLGIEYGVALDSKGEIGLVVSLIKDFNIKVPDAFLIMEAHSASIQYFLTWDDQKLIKKAKKVRWLIPQVMSPSDFLKK